MSCQSALVRYAVLLSLIVPGCAYAQFPPPAGSAGAGPSAINGIPYGPANNNNLNDPSGIGNASRMPPLSPNPPPPAIAPSGPANPSRSGSRIVTPSYVGTQRIIVPRQASSKRTPNRPRGRVETSKFTGICRGC